VDPELTEPPAPALGVAVDYDPAVWLAGPTDHDTDAWIAGAFTACASDFGVLEGTAEATYLLRLLTDFAAADFSGDFRFLRLRGLTDAPLAALLTVYVGAPAEELAAALVTFDEDATYYDRKPRIVEIDPARGLRRSLVFSVDDGIRSAIHYHRRVEEWAVDVLLTCAGADLKATALGLPDLDHLAGAVWLVDAEGRRR